MVQILKRTEEDGLYRPYITVNCESAFDEAKVIKAALMDYTADMFVIFTDDRLPSSDEEDDVFFKE